VETFRVWTLDVAAFDTLVRTVKDDGYQVTVFSDRPAATAAKPLSDYGILGLVDGAPWPMVEAAYRVMSKMHHPDVAGHGSTERMKGINLAYERLEKVKR
jgi:DnaJ-class molecular chaperone